MDPPLETDAGREGAGLVAALPRVVVPGRDDAQVPGRRLEVAVGVVVAPLFVGVSLSESGCARLVACRRSLEE